MIRRTLSRCYSLLIKETPNPDCLKFESSLVEFVPEGMTCDCPSPHYKSRHPLAGFIFDQYPEARAVFLANQYVTITKFNHFHWNGTLQNSMLDLLNRYVVANPAIPPELGDGLEGNDDTRILPDDDEVVQCIKELLAGNVRPMVQADGGNIPRISSAV